ncbi:hypothetical protein, partial [Listeria monocytogenes]|uniref:hypothetical protein n=1 Tax=Listeria monocytogenes TaxID=1639 RepID=UPI0024991D09|nr:hypothetical protein [Listeria monocytogenes]
DMGDFKKNKWKSLGYGFITFIIPFILGYLGGTYILKFPFLTSILFASLFSSQTLITYTMVSSVTTSVITVPPTVMFTALFFAMPMLLT